MHESMSERRIYNSYKIEIGVLILNLNINLRKLKKVKVSVYRNIQNINNFYENINFTRTLSVEPS